MANKQELLPTDFAMKLMEKCKFLEIKKSGSDLVKRTILENVIADFQRLSLCTDFDNALIAFFGHELTGEQKDFLKVVYDSTKPWVMGLTIDACLNAVTFKTLGRNEFAEALKTITEQTAEKKPEGGGKRMNGILVRVSKGEDL